MFKSIVLFILLCTLLFVSKSIEEISSSYFDHYLVQTEGTIIDNTISVFDNKYKVVIYYSYHPYNIVYYSHNFKNKNYSVFNTMTAANEFANQYNKGEKVIVYFNYKKPEQSQLKIGLDSTDYTSMIFLIPFISINILLLILAFYDRWHLLQINNPMSCFAYGLLGLTYTSMIGSFLIYFMYDHVLDFDYQQILLSIYIFSFILLTAIRKYYHSHIILSHKYQRLFNTMEMDIIESSLFRSFLYKIKRERILLLFLINYLILLLSSIIFIYNNHRINNMIYILIFLDIIISISYIAYFIKTEYNFNQRSTGFN